MIKKTIIIILSVVCSLAGMDTAIAQKKKKKKSIATVINVAESYKGTPYRLGGTSKSGIDCSGLIQVCFSTAGYKIPRTAKDQSKFGKNVSWGSVKAGDVVFFKFKEKGTKWYHSGLITKVKGDHIYFIHASTSSGVVESDLMSEYYKSNVKNFRRMI